MANWIIYGSDNVAKATVKELELHDEWMAECFLTVSVKSAEPIDFAVGDYIDYRGERYTIQYDPNVLKKAEYGSYGEGFTYDNIKFVGLQDEVVRCDFNDIVLNDNNVHYTALPTFPFYCETVDDLLDRIQANLEELYPGQWIVIGLNTVRNSQRGTAVGRAQAFVNAYKQYIDPTGTANTEPYGKQGVAETVDNITCWDAMKKVHDDFELNFIVRGRVIIVGTAGVFTANTFRYGKGNGLYEIERIGDSDQQIVTRLRAYGSEQNLPQHYYATQNKDVYATITNLKNKFGTQGAEFILDLDFDKKYFTYQSVSYPTTGSYPNYIVTIKANNISVRAYVTKDSTSSKCYVYCEYTGGMDDRDEPDASAMASFVTALANGDKVYFEDYVKKETFGEGHYEFASENLPDNMSVSRLMMPGFPNQSLNDWVEAHKNLNGYEWLAQAIEEGFTFSTDKYRPYIDSPNIDEYGVRPGSVMFDGSNETEDIHPTIDGMMYGNAPVDEIYAADQVEDNGVYPAGEEVKNINVILPTLGFDLDKVFEDGATIDMKNGMCGARSFKIANTPTKDSNNRWICNIERVHDDSLDLWFPYEDFQIHGSSEVGRDHGDKYVLTGITMPDEYIAFAAEKLLQAAIDALKKNHAPRYTYQPRIDELWMQRQHDSSLNDSDVVSLHDTLKAGDVFAFADDDLNIDANIIIDILTIRENGNNGVPTYEITLRDEKEVGTIQKIANKIDSAFSSAMNGAGGGSGLTPQQIQSLVRKEGNDRYLSKVDDDTAKGNISFDKNINVGGRETVNELQSTEYTGDGLLDTGYRLWYEEGRAKLVIDDLVARGKFTANELETRTWTYAGGNMVFSGAGSTLFFVEYLDGNENPLGYTYINQPWLLRGRALLAGGLAWSKRKAIQRELTEAEKAQVVKFRCYEYSDDGTMQTRNWWKPNDIAMCETLNKVRSKAASDGSYSGSASNTVYKRRIAGIGSKEIPMLNDGRVYDYVDLWNIYDLAGNSCKYKGTDGQEHLITDSVKGYDSSYHDWPAAGDVIVQMGNPLDTDRQSAVTIEVQGDVHGFKVYDTISDYSMANKLWVEIGYDQTTGKAKANVFGDFRFGCRESEEANGGSYVKYNRTTKQLDIKAKINMSSPLGDTGKTFAQTLTAIEGQIDQKAETWYQNTDPSSSWTTDAIKAEHVGDLWYCTADISGTSYGKDTTWYYKDNGVGTSPRYEWEQQNIPKSVFDTIDGKSAIFISKPSAYKERDMWVIESTIAAADLPTGCKVGDIVNATTDSTSYNKAHWVKKNCYTDDSYVQQYLDAIGGSGATPAQVATIQNNLVNALHAKTLIDGGLLLTSLIGMRKLRDGGNPDVAADYTTWGGISGEYVDNTDPDPQDPSAPYAKGHGLAAWYGGDMIDYEMLTSTQQQAGWGTGTGQCRYAKSVDRFDGSGYRASGNITWDANGDVTLKGQTVKSTAYYLGDTDITNKLNAVLSMFEIETINGVEWVHVLNNRPLYSDSDISALGAASGGGGGGGASVLYELNDVTPNVAGNEVMGIVITDGQTTAGNGYVLTFDGSTKKWYAAPPTTGATSLADLTDVNIGSQTNGQALLWNSSTSKWVAGDVSVNRINGIVKGGTCVLGGTHTGWINIARFDLNQYGNNDAQAFDLYVRRQYNSPESESFTCNISIGWNTGNIKVLNRVADHAIVDYIRVADSGNYRYIQLYVNPTYSTYENYTSFSIIGATGSWDSLDEVASGMYTEVCSCVLAAESGVAYQATDNNFITRTNEFNFVPSGFNLDIYINYRTVGGQNGSIGKYIFCDGAGNALAQLDNSNGGTILTNNNIKTINGNSIFGTGDIVISGGGGGGGNYLPLAGGTLTGLLGINTNGNTVTIGSQNNEWCHFYNSANVPFIFNKDVWTIGGLMPYDGSTYDIGSASRRWKSFYVGSVNASGTSVLGGGAKFGYICVECNSDGTAVDGYSSEINNFSGTLYLQHGSSQNLALCSGGGYVGIGTTNPSYKLHVAGDIYATGDVTAASDERAKDITDNIVLSIDDIANAPAIKFRWKDKRDELVHVGSIAQYWQKILPESVSDKNDVLGLNYGGAVMVGLVSVAKEVVSQDKRNNEQDEQIKELERQLNKANEKIISLENEVKQLKTA